KLMLDKFVDIIKNKDSITCVISGHTDNVPISTDKFPTNWELSSGRALSVVHYLISKGVDPTVLRGEAFGEYHPVSPNDTDAGRSMNRRIELTIVNAKKKK
ncbi:MAG: OmpA family protein, partial [Bacteroidota bacterium]